MNVAKNGDNARTAEQEPMADKRHADRRADQAQRDRELDAWLDRALGAHRPDPEPVVRDL